MEIQRLQPGVQERLGGPELNTRLAFDTQQLEELVHRLGQPTLEPIKGVVYQRLTPAREFGLEGDFLRPTIERVFTCF